MQFIKKGGGGGVDLSEYEKLAIPTTQDNLYTNLIPNNLLVPNQVYEVPYINVTPVSGTSPVEYHEGLVATWYNEFGVPTQLYYDDGVTPIADGDVEYIYLTATSTNTISPSARSKTFSKETINFKQDQISATKLVIMNSSGSIPTDYYISGQGNDAGGIDNNESNIIIASIIDSANIQLAGPYVRAFEERDRSLGYFYLNFYNTDLGTALECNDGNEGGDWLYNPTTHVLTDLTYSVDFTYFTSSSNNFDGYLMWQGLDTGSTAGKMYNYGTITVDSIIDDSNIVLGGDISLWNTQLPNTFTAEFSNDVVGEYANFDSSTEGVDWNYDPLTKIFTNLQNQPFDFRKLTSDYSYGNMNFSVVAKTFQGRIIGRNNLECVIEADNDWRSTLQKRYKTLMATYSNVNSYSKGQYVKYGGSIYRAYRDSTNQTPSFSSLYWQMLMVDAYYFSTSYNSIAIDTATYIYTPIFNTETIRINPVACNMKLGIRYSGEDCDMVLFGVTTNYSNFTSFGKQMTSTEQSSNSSINGMNSIYGRLDDTKILGTTTSYIGYTSGSNIAYIDNSFVMTIGRSNVYYISSSGINSINKSTIYYIYDTSAVKTIDSCIIYTLERCLFVGIFQSNTINSIINTQFIGQFTYNNITGSITDSIFYDTFNYNIIYGTIYGFYTYDYFTRNTLYYFIQNIGSIASPVRIRFLSNIFYNNMNAFTYNGNGVCNFTNNTIVGGLSNCTFNNSSSYLVTIQYTTFGVTTNLTFNNGGYTNILLSNITDFSNTTFSNTGSTYISGLTTYQASYGNTFNNFDIRNCRIGAIYNNTFGAAGKQVVIRDTSITGSINTCNVDRIVISDSSIGALSQLTVSGGDGNTAITESYWLGRINVLSMTAGSKIQYSVCSGQFSNMAITSSGIIGSCIINGASGWTVNASLLGITFLAFVGSYTFNTDISNIVYTAAPDSCIFFDTKGINYSGNKCEFKNYVAKTANYTLTQGDYLCNCNGTFTVTLPTSQYRTGQIYVIKNIGAGIITVATTSGQTIDGATTKLLATQYLSLMVMSDGANWIVIN